MQAQLQQLHLHARVRSSNLKGSSLPTETQYYCPKDKKCSDAPFGSGESECSGDEDADEDEDDDDDDDADERPCTFSYGSSDYTDPTCPTDLDISLCSDDTGGGGSEEAYWVCQQGLPDVCTRWAAHLGPDYVGDCDACLVHP
jgi:hypothetical protein